MEAANIDAVPMRHDLLSRWRANGSGVTRTHAGTGIEVFGAVDDIWQGPDGTVFVVDYKATGGPAKASLDATWQSGYKRQAEMYQWLLRGNDLQVSDTAYFVCCFADKDAPAFDGRLAFAHRIIPYLGDASWIDDVLVRLERTMSSPTLPPSGDDCGYCQYREQVTGSLASIRPP